MTNLAKQYPLCAMLGLFSTTAVCSPVVSSTALYRELYPYKGLYPKALEECTVRNCGGFEPDSVEAFLKRHPEVLRAEIGGRR